MKADDDKELPTYSWEQIKRDIRSLFAPEFDLPEKTPAPATSPIPVAPPATPPSASVTVNLRAVTVGDIYILCWKIWLATLLFALPFAIIWIISSRP